jgi:hypothetical protein
MQDFHQSFRNVTAERFSVIVKPLVATAKCSVSYLTAAGEPLLLSI